MFSEPANIKGRILLTYASAVDSPLDMQTISEKQKEDTELIAHMNNHKDLYFKKKLDG